MTGKKRMNEEIAITGTVSLHGTEQLKVLLQSLRVMFIASSTSIHNCVLCSEWLPNPVIFCMLLYKAFRFLYVTLQFLHTSVRLLGTRWVACPWKLCSKQLSVALNKSKNSTVLFDSPSLLFFIQLAQLAFSQVLLKNCERITTTCTLSDIKRLFAQLLSEEFPTARVMFSSCSATLWKWR